jgi:ribosomal protein S18 acetylase RimI-like enzyme
MTEEEYQAWAPRRLRDYAEEKARTRGLALAEAETLAAGDLRKVLPEGRNTPDHFLYAIETATLARAGYLWFVIRDEHGRRNAFVYDIFIDGEFRCQGLGRAAMVLLELEARRLGAAAIGLHVFGGNQVALELYLSLGYLVTDLAMHKDLAGR